MKDALRIYDGQFENGQRNGFGILTDNFENIDLDQKERMMMINGIFNNDDEITPTLNGY